ncbi:helix-turn-helix domain-containing protein [Streptomyces chryseus]
MVLRARLSRDEHEERVVRRLSRARKAPRDLVLRARMVDLSWSGQRVPAIGVESRCSAKTVRRWLHRFNRMGLDGLEDLGGRPPGRPAPSPLARRSRVRRAGRPGSTRAPFPPSPQYCECSRSLPCGAPEGNSRWPV